MSQNIIVKATFKNNKSRVVGLYNPKNNRVANNDEFIHLEKMLKIYIYPVQGKFKKVGYIVYTQNGNKTDVKSLGEAVELILNDKINN